MKIAKHVRKLAGYVPGEQPKSKRVVKLNTNENPYPPSPKCRETLAAFDLDRLRRYPDPEFSELRAELARLNGTVAERIFVGNGSDEILSLLSRAFVENDEKIGSLDPSYSLYRTLAAIRNVEWVGYPELPKSPDRKLSLFLLTNPNAPTGEFREVEEIASFAKRFRGILVVDEAYADFARDNAMRLASAAGNVNIIVMRTFSKSYSLAGLRVGYCVGPENLIAAMYKIKDSYNVDAVAQTVALAAVRDQRWMKSNVAKVIAERERLTAELVRRGWNVMPSESNFLFAKPPRPQRASAVFAHLKGENVFVRYFKGPKTGDRLRITVGTPAQNRRLLSSLDSCAAPISKTK